VARGAFSRAISALAERVLGQCGRGRPDDEMEIAS
jgi:hypothetical protein